MILCESKACQHSKELVGKYELIKLEAKERFLNEVYAQFSDGLLDFLEKATLKKLDKKLECIKEKSKKDTHVPKLESLNVSFSVRETKTSFEFYDDDAYNIGDKQENENGCSFVITKADCKYELTKKLMKKVLKKAMKDVNLKGSLSGCFDKKDQYYEVSCHLVGVPQ